MRLILTLLISFLTFPAFGQCVGENLIDKMDADERAELDAAIARHPYPAGNLWRAQKGGSTIHILGTMHLSDDRLGPYLEPIWPILDTTDLILLEGTRESMDRLKAKMASDPSVMFISDGPTLPEQLPEEDWQRVSDEMSARGVPGFMAAKMQPWFVSMMLAIPPCAMAEMAEQNGVDFRIMDYSESHSIPTRGLEPYDTLFSLFGNDSPKEELDALRLALSVTENGDAMIATLIETYLSGQHRAIWEFNRLQVSKASDLSDAETAKMFADMEGPMLINRNLNWMDVILPAADEVDNIIIAVGAAHLSGEKGLLYLLEQSGYSLTRVDGF